MLHAASVVHRDAAVVSTVPIPNRFDAKRAEPRARPTDQDAIVRVNFVPVQQPDDIDR